MAMTRRPRVTIREVARAAGVSTQTVSRVLNDRPDVAPATVERVRQVIASTGYAPNMLARGLTQGRTHIIGVVAFGLDYFGPSRILTGIEEQAAAMGYAITLTLMHRPETRDAEGLLLNLVARQVDGVIWAIPEVADNRRWLGSEHAGFPVPVILVGGLPGGSGVPTIGIDNRAIGRIATEHLLAGGARRIAIVTGPLDWWESQQRAGGWRDALRDAGRQPAGELAFEGDWTPSSGEQALYRLLERAPDVDAVFASNDQMALGVLHAAHRLGRRVPEDLAVVGADDIAEGSHYWPSLTTVHQPLRDAGALAVEDLDRMIRTSRQARRGADEPAEPSSLLEPELIVRSSTRPVAAS
jgi:LacI family transcriptional regulator